MELFPCFCGYPLYPAGKQNIAVFYRQAGYSFGDFKKKHYDDLYLHYEPYQVVNADFRNYGGLMLHPEMGVKVAISENADLLFSIA